MKIRTTGKLAAAISLAAIGVIVGMIRWSNSLVDDANTLRLTMTELTRSLTEQRRVSFDYVLQRQEHTQQREREVSAHVDHLITTTPFDGAEQGAVLSRLRARTATIHRLIELLRPGAEAAGETSVRGEGVQQFETDLAHQLLGLQQESFNDAFYLSDLATQRIRDAQQRMFVVTLTGLALIALMVGTAAWLLHRRVLSPIDQLEQATREVAAGNWDYQLDVTRKDEIGELSRHFDAMTRSLRESFAQINRSNQDLAALNHEIETFSYSVSHDLRGPLRSMDGFSLALLEDYGDKLDDEGRDALQRIRAGSQRMGRLIDELLTLSRVTRVELIVKPVDLSEIAREIADTFRRENPNRAVQWNIDEGVWMDADKALMQIVLQNLLENAWKFTSKTDAAGIHVGAAERDGKKVCVVADNGVGFDMAHADRMFDAFQRLHHESEFPGTGIGLAIVQRIIRRHGGRIWAVAQPGQGATFYFHLKE